MSENKCALIVASWDYQDTDLRKLLAPANDAEALARVLGDPKIGGFEVKTLLNKTSREMSEEIERFFLDRKRDDLLLLYFSGHGLKDDDGLLYFTASDTRLIDHSKPMRSTAISADFVREVMRSSKSRRQVLVLDCCYSGAFASAMMAKGDKSVGLKQQFDQGRGLVVMTASDALQYSFEGNKVEGEAVRSVFTSSMVRGIETGAADLDCDGNIALDELYDYVYAQVTSANSDQRPRKWNLDVEGKIIVAQTVILRAAELPEDLLAAMNSPLPRVRQSAARELGDLLAGSHKGLALAARTALAHMVHDDSRLVSGVAESLLAAETAAEPQGVQQQDVEQPVARPPTPPAATPPTTAPIAAKDVEQLLHLKPSIPPGAKPPTTAPIAAKDVERLLDLKPSIPPGTKPPTTAPAKKLKPAASAPRPLTATGIEGNAVRQTVGGNSGVPFNLPKWSLWPLGFAILVAIIFAFVAYRTPSSTSKQPTSQTASGSSGALPLMPDPVVLPRPPFDYYLAGPPGPDTKVRLTEVSEKRNQITDTEEWFGSNDLAMPTLTGPYQFKQEAGNIPSRIPVNYQGSMLTSAIKEGNQLLCTYGPDFASSRYLASFDLATGKPDFAFDFREFMLPPKFLIAEREFVKETVNWAYTEDGVLYVSTGHSTYAKSSYGLNAYLSAIEIKTGKLLWRSAPLVSNARVFLPFQDAIISGYGFTSEQNFLYVLNKKDGRVVQTVKLRKSPEFILNKGDSVFVRTYDTDYVFKASDQSKASNQY